MTFVDSLDLADEPDLQARELSVILRPNEGSTIEEASAGRQRDDFSLGALPDEVLVTLRFSTKAGDQVDAQFQFHHGSRAVTVASYSVDR